MSVGRISKMFADEAESVSKKSSSGFMPWRFWQKRGEKCDVTFLDESIEDGFARYEHNLKGADGKWGNIVPCIKTESDCPVCKEHGASTLVLYLSVLVHRPFVSKKTGETKEHTKMFLCIKRGQLEDFLRVEKIAKKNHKTLKGVTVTLSRDNEPTSFSTGMPVPSEETGNILSDYYNEADLCEAFGHPEIKTKEGTVIKAEDEDTKPYDYMALMPQPDPDEFISQQGGSPSPGSTKEYSDYIADEDSTPPIVRRRRVSSKSKAEAEPKFAD